MSLRALCVDYVRESEAISILKGVISTRGKNVNTPEMVNYANPVEYIPETEQAPEGIRQNNAESILNEISLFFGLLVELK